MTDSAEVKTCDFSQFRYIDGVSNPTSLVYNGIKNNTSVEDISVEQEFAFQKFLSGQNLFISGSAGTGKSYLIKRMVTDLRNRNIKYQVCGLTGTSAILLKCGAKTIHSWSGVRLAKGKKDAIIQNVMKNKFAKKNWTSVQVLIIDEVSMLSKKIFEILNELGQLFKKNSAPFGGIQVIFTGDFFQLPCVGDANEPDTRKFCFESSIWDFVFSKENQILLKKVFRQKDPTFIELLNSVRKGEITPEHIELLSQRRIKPVVVAGEEVEEFHPTYTKLLPIRQKVDAINKIMFDKIPEKEVEFPSIINTANTTYNENGAPIPTEMLQYYRKFSKADIDREVANMIKNMSMNEHLVLKRNALVICCSNLDVEKGICNGSQGIVVDFAPSGVTLGALAPVVKFTNGVVMQIPLQTIQSEECPVITISQYPLLLAWAMTIHRSQGVSLDYAEIDIGIHIFEYGQAYVALSRVKTLGGLYLTAFQPERIKANPIVVDFYRLLEQYQCKYDNEQSISNDMENIIVKETQNDDITSDSDKEIKKIVFPFRGASGHGTNFYY